MGIPLSQQVSNESRLSMSESVSEFFDAQEVLLSASSSENEVCVCVHVKDINCMLLLSAKGEIQCNGSTLFYSPVSHVWVLITNYNTW